MFAILLREKKVSLCFSANNIKFAIFCNTFFVIICPVVVRRLIERLVRLMKLNNHPQLSAYTTRDEVFRDRQQFFPVKSLQDYL